MSEPTPPPAPRAAPVNKALFGLVGMNLLVTVGLGVLVVTRPTQAAPVAVEAKSEGPHDAAKSEGHGEKAPAKEAKAEEGEHGEAAKNEKEEGHGEAQKEGGHGEAAAANSNDDVAAVGTTARLEDIIVHLRNPEVDRYARLTLDVEMSNASELAQLQPRTPQIRDAVITALSEETYESLRGGEGLLHMKNKVRERIDAVVPGTVRAVYVSGFIVQ